MKISRRHVIGATTAAIASSFVTRQVIAHREPNDLSSKIISIFKELPGHKGLYITTKIKGVPYEVALNPDDSFFIASAFKVFVLTRFLQIAEQEKIAAKTQSLELLDKLLPLEKSVYFPGAPAFFPGTKGQPLQPTLEGLVLAKIVCQEMIAYSDNTATEMLLKFVGVDKVRSFLESAGLTSVKIPDSLRQFFLYLFGFPKGYDTDFDTFQAIFEDKPYAPQPPSPQRSLLNNVETMKGAPRQLAQFYRRTLRGEFFKERTTRARFREFMSSTLELIEASVPRGSAAYTKNGYNSFNGENAVSTAGAMQTLDHFVYYSLIINWEDQNPNALKEVEPKFYAAQKEILTLIRNKALS